MEFTAANVVDFDLSIYTVRSAMRADAALPLPSLAVDNLGVGCMSSLLTLHDGATHWDCLARGLHDVLCANLLCYASKDGDVDGQTEEGCRHAVKEARINQGVNIVLLSNCLALMRGVFHLDTASPSDGAAPI